ncbi:MULTISPECIES: metallophosphoesterase [Variovorax]|jgi:3',5'-cyclic AMP phosphodiesterase CpdA|uniref:metallophosphoesterase n=1 Tax=Variovorax TaxID=34072 RepID=UPI00086E978D|nr:MULTISPECIES: metallophosphoesterase [Variovorax]MBN8753956.1 metallophosphoesterase [Variovorax sp.]ODU15339.1 MAG: phosphoesterase [Variovorax sp. SCN 67-85]ODV24107.1 MAG: phosphoesterase [Variovorax sp. SCN 67-20]OJZ04694.1 MAG: phosphoesterase [Variovorax sp. 67-131]UKI09900.1 metallophosphoesterase [Variovorax paradoxus]
MTFSILRTSRAPSLLACAAVLSLLAACGGSDNKPAVFLPSSSTPAPGQATPPAAEAAKPVQVAFMPDIHFHDVYASFKDGSFPGVFNPKSGRNATIRQMQAQMTSTRLFNENYFAFITALDDAVARGVKLIALPGDFSDDGQPVHMRGLKKVLDDYAAKYDLQFFAAPGNHDPNTPMERPGGKGDYLGIASNGRVGAPQKIYSKGADACTAGSYSGDWGKVGAVYCTEEVKEMGYAGITEALDQHGFMPKANYRYFETPYSTYTYQDYTVAKAKEQAAWSKREFEICAEGAGGGYKKSGYTFCHNVPDTSYLVEPVEGLWLVGIDANVYVPKGAGANDFNGSGDAGYNKMLTHKPHVIAWLKDVVARGKKQGKQVVAFSHFPMSEFFNGASDDIVALLGAGKMQMVRRPTEDVTKALAETGLQVHVGGHMHFNDTAVRNYDGGRGLVNIQAPSMAAYVPAYKLLTFNDATHIDVQTVRLDNVARFDELFDLYREEHRYFTDFPADLNGAVLWDKSVLDAKSYGDFSTRYMSELVRLRLLKDDWRCEMRELVKSPLNGADLLVLSQLQTSVTLKQLANTGNQGLLSGAFFACLAEAGGDGSAQAAYAIDYAAAEAKARALASANGMRLEDFNQWKAIDLAGDFVRLANAGDLAFADIPTDRARQYKLIAQALEGTNATLALNGSQQVMNDNPVNAVFQARFKPLMQILLKLAKGAPTQHFVIDLKTNTLTDLTTGPTPF